jgi:hypothetical protein
MGTGIPSYRLKIERAKRHIRELAEEIETFFARQPYVILSEDNHARGQRVWKVSVRACVPTDWSAIVGDAIHNVRSSLDLLAVEVVRFCDPARASYNHVKFPFGKSKDVFEARARETIKGASREARTLFDNLKPYKGGDEALWRIHELDILDKHKAIIPVGASHSAVQIDAMAAFRQEFPDRAKGLPAFPIGLRPADHQFPLQDGAEVFAAPLGGDPFEDDVKFMFEIAFGEGQIVDGEPVVPALTQMRQFVEDIFDLFERRILNTQS